MGRWHKPLEQVTSCPDPTDSHILSQTPSASQMRHGHQSWESGTEGLSAGYEGWGSDSDFWEKESHKVVTEDKVPVSQFCTEGLR